MAYRVALNAPRHAVRRDDNGGVSAVATGSGSGPGKRSNQAASSPAFHPLYLFLLVPFIALLWPPFYAMDQPELSGIPFFYWYQFLWLVLTAILTAIVYGLTRGGTES